MCLGYENTPTRQPRLTLALTLTLTIAIDLTLTLMLISYLKAMVLHDSEVEGALMAQLVAAQDKANT